MPLIRIIPLCDMKVLDRYRSRVLGIEVITDAISITIPVAIATDASLSANECVKRLSQDHANYERPFPLTSFLLKR